MAINPGVHILLTRPAAQSAAYGAELRQAFGEKATITSAPLLEIVPLEVTLDLHGVQHLLFTSVNAVQAFVALSDQRQIPCLCVGDKTATAATTAGMEAISAGGNVKDLIALARQHPPKMLYLRGQHIAHALSDHLHNLREAVIYKQNALDLNPTAKTLLTKDLPVLLPLFSPRSAGLLADQIAALKPPQLTAICLSGNVAAKLDPKHFTQIVIAATPTASAVTREIAALL